MVKSRQATFRRKKKILEDPKWLRRSSMKDKKRDESGGKVLHPKKTNTTMENHLKLYLTLKMVIFHCHVSFQGGNSFSWMVFGLLGGSLLQNHYAYGIWLRYSSYNLPQANFGKKTEEPKKKRPQKPQKNKVTHSNNLANVYWPFQKGCDHPTSLRFSSNSSLKFQSFSVVGDTSKKSDHLSWNIRY